MKAKKKKTLPKDFEQMLEKGTKLSRVQAVFETCDVNARGGYDNGTALMMSGCTDELTRWLVANGADLAAVDRYGNTALHARARDRRGRLKVLLELGCDVNARTTSLGTPLHAAADTHNVDAISTLLDGGALVNAKNSRGWTPLDVALLGCTNAALEDAAHVARLLLDAGARKTRAMKAWVGAVGKTFEFHRSNFNPEFVDAASDGLHALYRLFGVAPVAPREMHDGTSPIKVKARSWPKQHAELWRLLVPSYGPAKTAQGEVIRISGRIADEFERNGGMNWDADFKAMARAFLELVQTGTPLPAAAASDCQAIVASLVKRGIGDDDRLAELAVAWVLLNPQPRRLGKVTYSR